MISWMRKKPEELLVSAPRTQSADGRPGGEAFPGLDALTGDVDRVASALRGITGREARARAVAAMQAKFGNAFSTRVLDAVQRAAADAPPPPANAEGEPQA